MDNLSLITDDKFFVSVAFTCGIINEKLGGHIFPVVIVILNALFTFFRGIGTQEFVYAIFMLSLYAVAFYVGGWIVRKAWK